MDGTQIISETFAEMLPVFFALLSGLLLTVGIVYLGKAIWIIVRRRKY